MFDALDNWLAFGHGLPPLKELEALSLSELKLNKGGVIPRERSAADGSYGATLPH